MNRVCSIFSQLLQLFSASSSLKQQSASIRPEPPRSRLYLLGPVRSHAFLPNWVGPIAYGRFGQGLAASRRQLKAFGRSDGSLAPSTLAYANQHRPWQFVSEQFFSGTIGARCEEQACPAGGRKFRFKNKLLSLDATVIDLCASLYDWGGSSGVPKEPSSCTCCWIMDGYLPPFCC